MTRAARRIAAQKARRRLPSLSSLTALSLPSLSRPTVAMPRPTVVKGLVGLGLASSVAAAVAIPVQAAPGVQEGEIELGGQTNALLARDRAASTQAVSRGSARTAVAGESAVTAPIGSAPVAAGPVGVTAVAKPKPKPKPEATRDEESSSSSRSSSGSSSSSSSSTRVSGAGVSMAYYSWCDNKGLGNNASIVCSAVRSNFGITNIGGYRAGAGDHGTGRAVDVMVSGSRGDAVAQWAINNMGRYNISYVIWKQRIWLAGASGWRAMEDRGGVTANHYDHVHISVE